MKQIDFKHFKMFTDITQENTIETDISRDFADTIYKNANGIVAHDLALRIYRATEPLALTDEELAFLHPFISGTTPVFQDSFNANIIDHD